MCTNHTIKNQHGMFITDPDILTEIKHMLEKGLDFVEVCGKRVTVFRDFRKDGQRETIVEIEGVNNGTK